MRSFCISCYKIIFATRSEFIFYILSRFRSNAVIEDKPEEPAWKKAILKAFQKFVIGAAVNWMIDVSGTSHINLLQVCPSCTRSSLLGSLRCFVKCIRSMHPMWTMSSLAASSFPPEIPMLQKYSTGEELPIIYSLRTLHELRNRVISENGNGPPIFIDDLLATLTVPLMLLWGIKDPWIRPQAAEQIQVILS